MKIRYDFLLILAISSIVLISGLMRPLYNWDIIGYVSSVYKYQGLDKEQVHNKAYLDIKNTVPTEKYNSLVEKSSPYRFTVYEDSESLWQNIPFYSIRYIYIKLVEMVSANTGFSYSYSTVVVSAFSAMLSCIIFYLIIRTCGLSYVNSLLVFPLGIVTLARLSTPDALGLLFILVSAYLFLLDKKYLLSFVMIIMPLVRTDYIVYIILFSIINFNRDSNISGRGGERLLASITILFSLLCYFSINFYEGNLGYLTIFNFSFINIDPYPFYMNISSNVMDYIHVYISGAYGLLLFTPLGLYLLIALISVNINGFNIKEKLDILLLSTFLTMVCYFLLYPSADQRHYTSFYAILLIASVSKFRFNSVNLQATTLRVIFTRKCNPPRNKSSDK